MKEEENEDKDKIRKRKKRRKEVQSNLFKGWPPYFTVLSDIMTIMRRRREGKAEKRRERRYLKRKTRRSNLCTPF